MQRVILQVPMDRELRDKATAIALSMGFSSLQEAIRVILTKMVRKELVLTFKLKKT